MSTTIRFVEGPLPDASHAAPLEGLGARVMFEGIVRRLEGERVIEALLYEAYRPMAERVLADIAASVEALHGATITLVEHSVGRVAVGAYSFRLIVDARHRKEALAAADDFIDRMKKDAPIWKSAV